MAKQRPTLSDALQTKGRRSYSPAAAAAVKEAAKEDTVRLNVNVPASLYRRFQEQAEAEGRSVTWLVTRFVEQYAEAGGERGAPFRLER